MKRILMFAAAIVFAVTTYAQAAEPSWHLDVVNRSNACVWFTVDNRDMFKDFNVESAVIHPGAAREFRGRPSGVSHMKARAQVWKKNCTGAFVGDRRDDFPSEGNSQLSIHNSGSGYIMRHGP
jgi:hypothetical protein